MSQQTVNILIAYWIITTVIGIYWMIKNPRPSDDKEYFDLTEVVSKIFPCMCLAWFLAPFMILASIKFKR